MRDFEHLLYCRNLAAALLQSEWSAKSLHRNATAAVGPRRRWLKPLLARIAVAFPQLPRTRALIEFITADAELLRARAQHRARHGESLAPVGGFSLPDRMQPPAAPVVRAVPTLETPAQLAGWLGIPIARLDWYADRKNLNGRGEENLAHYRYRWLPKRNGTTFRLLEEPKPILKSIQRQILIDILGCLDPHDAAHGFRRNRSIATNAAEHCGRAIVVRFDLTDFFASIPVGKVAAIFDSLGYPEKVARILASLCSNRLPLKVWNTNPGAPDDRSHATWLGLSFPHLPQGAPTSPALANLCALHLDYRLSALARNLDATYTRYADDLTFSGPGELAVARLQRSVMRICAEEGFALNPTKTRIQRRSSRQMVAGVVVNVRPNIPRGDYDLLKAILTNCAKSGPTAQNRLKHPDFRAYLAGRIAFAAMLNPRRARKLWTLFDRIDWAE